MADRDSQAWSSPLFLTVRQEHWHARTYQHLQEAEERGIVAEAGQVE